MKNWAVFLIVVSFAVLLTILGVSPPSASSLDGDITDFSSSRAQRDIREIAKKPHPTGSKENARVRQYLMSRMRSMGMQVKETRSPLTASAREKLEQWSGESVKTDSIYNIIGVLPGKDSSKPAILLMAHHDTYWGSPGAADDSIGIGVILEVLRAINLDNNRKRDVFVLFTDAEELGLVGAKAFFNNNPMRDQIGAIINLEARGAGGTANLFQLNGLNEGAARLYSQNVREPSISSLSAFVYEKLPNDTDLTPALEHDYIAYNFAIIGKAGMYHSPLITPNELDESSVQHMGLQTLDLTRELLSVDQLPTRVKNVTFFDLYGLFVLIYDPVWGWVFLAIGLFAFLLTISDGFVIKDLLEGVKCMTLFIVTGGGLLYALNILSGHGQLPNGVLESIVYYDRLAAIPRLKLIFYLSCSACFLFFYSSSAKSNSSHFFGLAAPIMLLGIIGQSLAPTATYFISLPIFLVGLAAYIRSKSPYIGGFIVFPLIATLVSGFVFSLAYMLLQGVGPNMLWVTIFPVALAAIALAPIYPAPSRARSMSLVLLLLAIGVALWIRLDDIAETVPRLIG